MVKLEFQEGIDPLGGGGASTGDGLVDVARASIVGVASGRSFAAEEAPGKAPRLAAFGGQVVARLAHAGRSRRLISWQVSTTAEYVVARSVAKSGEGKKKKGGGEGQKDAF